MRELGDRCEITGHGNLYYLRYNDMIICSYFDGIIKYSSYGNECMRKGTLPSAAKRELAIWRLKA
jgi:hypothetical protein